MFASFFPRPRLFFISAALWISLAIALWYGGAQNLGAMIELPGASGEDASGVSIFWSTPILWFYIYYWAAAAIFGLFWWVVAPHPWSRWSIWGSALIIFTSYLEVEVKLAINTWFRPFFDMVQSALLGQEQVTLVAFYEQLVTFGLIVAFAVITAVLTAFFASHYAFRWRTAMNDYYAERWPMLRNIEGASQRLQDDTMRFARATEDLGVKLVGSILTLAAFLPLLMMLSQRVTDLPLVGHVPDALVVAASLWSVFGTGLLGLIGIRLPGLAFRNQRVEAAYRKELAYGEDNPERAQLPILRELFSHVRQSYFRLYLNYLYFNIGRILYLQTDFIFPYLVLAPSIIAGLLTLGLLHQITNALQQVRTSMQYLIHSWEPIIDLTSIYKRLRGFDIAIADGELPAIEREGTAKAY
jgi:peptide/bleomycin uptake transporter